ncbi:NAD-dependent epimerase/dehydratase [Natrinema pellirubrum DSM 15624]|uniref:NAD-dependent epimerase/dehydratase n=2 Tax=Natrinema pellirubrum (strain DSM 15624 / CIP 106293 / JCM 10476 / NCIMB 786 / 157) TaxID=797303 RepID=L9YJB7_NATP1|nr:SDR family oxidoreductase [Natrinema pellirubrum]ELY73791.1 NAD-dependent epimerase/dehydratase [Natrinema pellirubrum DSM 15624]
MRASGESGPMHQSILVAGSHGGVGQHVTALLAEGDYTPRAMIRDESQREELERLGGEPVVADLTEPSTLERALEGCDAVVFAAGSGGEDVYGVDRDGAINLIDAAGEAGIDRFVMLSSMGADDPDAGPEPLRDYLIAKAEADEYLRHSGLEYTIVRPGELTDESGTGEIRAAEGLELGEDDIPREDVAATLVAAIDCEPVVGETFEILSGENPIPDALEAVGSI